MTRRKKRTIKVKVVARRGRGVYVFRWQDHDGNWNQQTSDVQIGGPSAREERKSRNIAERAAADLEVKLNALPTDDERFEPHIATFVRTVQADGATMDHLLETRSRLERFAREARTPQDAPLASVREITEACIVDFVNGLKRILRPRKPRTVANYSRKFAVPRTPPPVPPTPPPVPASQQTKNHYITTIKAFCAYLTRHKFFEQSPAERLSRGSTEADRRRERRALTPDEFAKLVAAAAAGGTVETLTGADRAMLYILATWTGFRAKELASLTLRSFTLDGPSPAVRCKAAHSKHRKDDSIPIHPAVVSRLREWVQAKGLVSLDAPLFDLKAPGGRMRKTAKMMRVDLAAAGLPYQDEAGAFADFHANRAAFVTNLANAGVNLFRAQKLARHSDPKLTANIYAKATPDQLSEDVDRLPDPPSLGGSPSPEAAQVLRFKSG